MDEARETRRASYRLSRAAHGIYRDGKGLLVIIPDDGIYDAPWPEVITIMISNGDLLNNPPSRDDGSDA